MNPRLVLTPRELAMKQRIESCETEIKMVLSKYDCRLSVRDVVIDGVIAERTVTPVPIELGMFTGEGAKDPSKEPRKEGGA